MKHQIAAAALCVMLLALWLLTGTGGSFFLGVEVYPHEFADIVRHGSWFQVANGSHNAYYMWRWDPLLAGIADRTVKDVGMRTESFPVVYHLLCLLLAVAGTGLLCLRIAPKAPRLGGFTIAAAWLLVLLGLWGADGIVLSGAAWLPWLTLVLVGALSEGGMRWSYYLLTFFFAYRISATANQLALLWDTAAFAMAFVLAPPVNRQRAVLTAALCLAPALVVLVLAPLPPYPDYPPLTRVVPYDGVPGMIRPLIGPDAPPVPVIDWVPLHRCFSRLAIVLFAAVLLLPSFRGQHALPRSRLFTGVFILTLLLLGDTISPESISQILPIAVVNRLVPHFFFFPLTVPLAAITVWALLLLLRRARAEVYAASLAMALALIPYHDGPFPMLQTAALQEPDSRNAWREFSALHEPDAALQRYYNLVLCSPSLRLLNKYGLWLVEQRSRTAAQTFAPLLAFDPGAQVSASGESSPLQLSAMTDRHRNTRWSNKAARQTGSEWVFIHFPSPRVISGIDLSPGETAESDFPRGLRLRGAEHCTSTEDVRGTEPLSEFPVWEGGLRLTPQGFPYCLGESNVEILLRKPHQLQCILVEQTGYTPYYEWSIGEIGVLGE